MACDAISAARRVRRAAQHRAKPVQRPAAAGVAPPPRVALAARGRAPLSICSCARTLKGYKARNGALDKYHKNFLAVVERLAAGKFVAWGGCVVD